MSQPSLIKETAKLCFVVTCVGICYAGALFGTIAVVENNKAIREGIVSGVKAAGSKIKDTTASVKSNITNRWEIAKIKRQAKAIKAEAEAAARNAVETVPQPQKNPVEA